MLVDNILIQYMLTYQVNNVNEFLNIADKPFITKPLYFAINKNLPDAENIMTGFNAEIKKMISDGTYNTILGLNWIEADINGDGQTEIVLSNMNIGEDAPTQSYPVFYRDQQSYSEKAYVIDNEYYSSWSDVPVKFKNKSRVETKRDGNPGFEFNF